LVSAQHFLNDLTIAANGDVYVTDSLAGTVYVLGTAAAALRPLVDPGTLPFANGIVLSGDERTLFVSTRDGLVALGVASRRVTPLGAGRADGLALHRGHLVAVQPWERGRVIVRHVLDGTRRVRSEVIVPDHPEHLQPTTGVVVGDAFYYIANSQLQHFRALVRPDGTFPLGFEVLDELSGAAPAVIFLTAHDRFAIRAFEAAALDYLLKPFDEERFARALDRARRALGGRGRDRARTVAFTPGGLTRLVVKHAGRIRFVRVADVSRITAEANYARVHAAGEVHLVRESLGALEDDLDPSRFVRIHRATIVNLDRVRELEPMFNGQYTVVLDDGARLTMSRRFRPHLERRLGRPLP